MTETSLLLLNIYVLPFLADMLQKNIENKTFKYKEDTCVTKWEAENMKMKYFLKICGKGNFTPPLPPETIKAETLAFYII